MAEWPSPARSGKHSARGYSAWPLFSSCAELIQVSIEPTKIPAQNRDGVYDKIAEARMSTGNRQLSKLDTGAEYHRPNAR